MVDFPNPPAMLVESREHLGTLWDAARVARVKPGTIRVWMSRRKIEPMDLGDGGPELFHLPTIEAAAQRRPGRPAAA
ncbi:hypothetical protein [Streptomyces sp. NPDC007063]|uniref:hypothetical protein n=1 Tax=Streptomyces sp. NPDC007063 TaxID=3364772 RepID=UPI0036C8EC42